MSEQSKDSTPTAEKTQPCPVPECNDGYVRVPIVVQRRHYGTTETFARMDDIQCDECGGLGTVTGRVA